MPADTFVDQDTGQRLSYAVAKADGTALPRWLSFDERTLTFSGRPLNRDVGQFRVRLTATDSGTPGLSVWTEFSLTVTSHPYAWQNAALPADVDGNGTVAPLDVLIVINSINRTGPGPVPDSAPEAADGSFSFLDVNADNFVTPSDALGVIATINNSAAGGVSLAAGEPSPSAAFDLSPVSPLISASEHPVTPDFASAEGRAALPVEGLASPTAPLRSEAEATARWHAAAVDELFGHDASPTQAGQWDALLDVLAGAVSVSSRVRTR